jgi:hypothetical protein
MTVRADVVVYGGVPRGEAARIREVLTSFGVTAQVRIAGSPGGRPHSWVAFVSLSVRSLVERLGSTIADRAERLGELIRRVALDHVELGGLIVLVDTETGIEMILEPALPADALRSFQDVDLEDFTFGPVHYDAESSGWRSLLDEPR